MHPEWLQAVDRPRRRQYIPVTEELFRRALACVPAVRRGLEALQGTARCDDPSTLAETARVLREPAAAAEDTAGAPEFLEYARAGGGAPGSIAPSAQAGLRQGVLFLRCGSRGALAGESITVLALGRSQAVGQDNI